MVVINLRQLNDGRIKSNLLLCAEYVALPSRNNNDLLEMELMRINWRGRTSAQGCFIPVSN